MSVPISVIIPVYRDWERLAVCLEALERQTLAPDRFEILVANNEPEPRAPLGRWPSNARMIHEPRPGSYVARNAAVAASAGRYLAFTDSDCQPEPQWLASGLALLEAHPDVRLTGPVEIFREPGAGYYAYLHDHHLDFLQREYIALGACATANLMVARSVFDRVGRFEEYYSGGDFVWNKQARAAGVPILYDASVCVRHPARRRIREIFRKRRRTAGSTRRHISTHRYVLQRLKPPLRRLFMLRRERVGWKNAIVLFLILWAARLLQAQELILVRLGIKKPSRS